MESPELSTPSFCCPPMKQMGMLVEDNDKGIASGGKDVCAAGMCGCVWVLAGTCGDVRVCACVRMCAGYLRARAGMCGVRVGMCGLCAGLVRVRGYAGMCGYVSTYAERTSLHIPMVSAFPLLSCFGFQCKDIIF